ncbi:DUF4267 domain-containing protein [Nocardiopsis coralliicola]
MSGVRILSGLTAAVGVAVAVIGIRFLVAPEAAVAGFGTADPAAYLDAKGVRDLVCGAVALACLGLFLCGALSARGLAVLVAVFSAVPAGDAVIVLSRGGTAAAALGIHGATALAMLGIALGLWRAAPGRAFRRPDGEHHQRAAGALQQGGLLAEEDHADHDGEHGRQHQDGRR